MPLPTPAVFNEPLEEECRYGGLVIVHLYDDVVKDWSFVPDGEDDVWQKAEQVITKRNQTLLVEGENVVK